MDATKPIEKVMYGNTEIPLKTLNLQTKEVEPQTVSQTITPDEEYGGLSQVDIAAVTSSIDGNIQARNIKVGVTILGVAGSLEPDKPDQEKTVTPTEQTQEVVADAGYELVKAIVNPIPSNYKNTNNATATASDILAGKVAVNQNGDVTGNIQTYSGAKSITPSASQQTFSTNGKYLDDDLVVNATPTETKTPTIDFTGVTSVDVEPTSGKFLTKVTIERPEDLVSANIRVGKTMFGIDGNLEPDKPDQTKTVTPTKSAQVVEPDTGYELASVTVNATPTEQKTVKSTTSSQTITPTSGKFIDEITVSPVVYQERSVDPSTSSQDIIAESGYDALSKVTVSAIQTESQTVKSTGISQTITPTSGKYINEIIVNPIVLQSKSVDPTTIQQVVEAENGYDGLSSVTITAVDPDDYTDPYNAELVKLNSGSGVNVTYEQNATGTTVNIHGDYTTEPNATGTTVII